MLQLLTSNPFDLAERDAHSNGKLSIDRGNNSMKAELLQELLVKSGISDARGNFNLDLEIESSSLKNFSLYCQQKSYEIMALLGVSVRMDISQKPMTQLNSILQLIGMKMNKSRQEDNKSGARTFFYKIERDKHDLIFRYLPLMHRKVDIASILGEMKERQAKKKMKNDNR